MNGSAYNYYGDTSGGVWLSQFVRDVDLIINILSENKKEVFHVRNLEEKCTPSDQLQFWFQMALIPAALVSICFSFTQKRTNLLLDCCYGRPSFAYPMDIFTKNCRTSYTCAFGSTVYLVYKIIFERFYAFDPGSQPYMRPIAAIVSMLIYGVAYLPVFICITVGSVYGYGVGSLYIWFMTSIEIYSLIGVCNISATDRLILISKRLPQLLCLLYLSIQFPWRFAYAIVRRRFVIESMECRDSGSVEAIKQTYYGQRVINLLSKARTENPQEQTGCLQRFIGCCYKWENDFQFSARLITTQVVGAMVLYQVTFESVAYFASLFTVWHNTLQEESARVDIAYKLDPTESLQRSRDVIKIATDFVYIFRIFVIVSLLIATCLGFFSILASFPTYRRYLTALFKGDYRKLTKTGKPLPNPDLLTGCMRYAGYQVGYVAWGFVIQCLVFIIISLLLTTAIVLISNNDTTWLVDTVSAAWPVPIIGLLVNFSQVLGARFIYLQERGVTLSLTNRRVFFIATYFTFFYNIFMGVVSCLMRVLKSLVFGLFFLPRLDHSVLPPAFRFKDPGYQSYVGYLRLESLHSHPVVLTFVNLVLIGCKNKTRSLEKEDGIGCDGEKVLNDSAVNIKMADFEAVAGEEDSRQRGRKLARYRWCIGYTLLNNPGIRLMRRGYLQAQDKALGLGLRLPVSDGVLTWEVDTIRKRTTNFLAEKEESEKQAKMKARIRCNKINHKDGVAGLEDGDKILVDDGTTADDHKIVAAGEDGEKRIEKKKNVEDIFTDFENPEGAVDTKISSTGNGTRRSPGVTDESVLDEGGNSVENPSNEMDGLNPDSHTNIVYL